MTPPRLSFASWLRQSIATRLAALRERVDEGQALVLALIVVLLIGLLPAIILSSLNQEMPYASESVNYESALAAAEAGVQEYANLMDQYPGYFYNTPQAGGATTTPGPSPHPLPGGPNLALGAWAQVAGTNPPESFTYYPDTSQLTAVQSSANPFGGDVLLVVTGRAGSGKTVQYRRVEAAFTVSGILTDVYFSNFEQPAYDDLDQWQNTYQSGCTGSCGYLTSGPHEYDEATTTTPTSPQPTWLNPSAAPYVSTSGTFSGDTGVPMATALCEYDATQVNSFIDWYSQNVAPIYPQPGYPNAGTAYGSSNEYYGPWYGSFPDLSDPSYQFGQAPTSGSTNNGDSSACNTNYWITGDTFNGPVYSQDELTTCSQAPPGGGPTGPAFTSLLTAAPGTPMLPATKSVGWPGAGPPQAVPLSTSSTGYASQPYGYNWDPWRICGGGSGTPNPGVNAPTFGTPPQLGVSQSLPSANQELLTEIETGKVAGCVYTGPTMIRFSYSSSGGETMSVWSPLTKDTYGVNSPTPTPLNVRDSINCGATATSGFRDLCAGTTCTSASGVPNNTQVLGKGAGTVQTGNFAQVPITSNLLIAVQGATSGSDPNAWSTLPAAETGATVSGCIDPWVNPDSGSGISTATCTEGDAILSGAVSYQTTISASANIVIARSLVYGCAVNGGTYGTGSGSTGTYQYGLTGCQSSPDVLGLIALDNIWMARPWSPSSGMAPKCTDNYDMVPASITWSDMVANCTVVNPVIDAATAALTGFFEVEYWKEGNAAGGTIYFNGSDAVNNAGQYGTFGYDPATGRACTGPGELCSGYLLNLNYDPRLKADPPPQYLPATDGVWTVAGWVTCGSTVPNPDTAGYPTSTIPACTPLAGSVPP
ncbi:MAG: hypothetical protein ACYCST_11940 [Acidimicrobiales bacterium]